MAERRRDVPILRARTVQPGSGSSRPPPGDAVPASEASARAGSDRISPADVREATGRQPSPTLPPRHAPSSRPPSSDAPTASSRARLGSGALTSDELHALGPVRAPSAGLRPGWTDDLLVGDRHLDRQHKRFFLHAARLAIACEQGRGQEEIDSALRFLREYATAHFADEERTMQEVAYPYMASHAEAHASFLSRLATLEAELERQVDKRALALDISYMTASWFAEHVRQVDRILARFLATRDD